MKSEPAVATAAASPLSTPRLGAHARRVRACATLAGAGASLATGLLLLAFVSSTRAEGPGAAAWAMLVVLAGLSALGGWLLGSRLANAIAVPLSRVSRAIEKLNEGDFDARTGLSPGAEDDDELIDLAVQLDTLADDRLSPMVRLVQENESLNNSVIEIMQAVGTIATTKDLGLRVPVTEDVTGAISDALNLLTDETARVLRNVSGVCRQVAAASIAVKGQSESASQAAAREQREVELAARELAQAASSLAAIAAKARACNEAAERAVRKTGDAMRIVGQTVDGIAQSRELIRETEKRIKRLGERSQEIGQVVGFIESIAERTGILALNASMHAAAAGDAGRNFAAVADEVKRLSQTVGEATGRISRLVTAIQTETNDTVIAMNQAITRVVEISRLADDASQEMQRTQHETETLAASVRDIARTSTEQAKVGAGLQERARIIQEASAETSLQLVSQATETRRLVDFSQTLLDEVAVFKLPREE